MATLKILRCKQCTAPLPAGTTTCPKCHAVNLVQSEVNPLRLPSTLTNDYIAFFKQQTEANPKDTNALFGMGLVYMGLKNYELAQRNFKLAVDQSPLEPDVYYYFALSLFEGHNPMHLNHAVTSRIEEWLHTATNRQAKRKYLILQMVLRQGAFVANGLQVKGEQPRELYDRICTMVPEVDEISEIEEHIQITDAQTLAWLEDIKLCKNGKPAKQGKAIRLGGEEIVLGVDKRIFAQIDSVTERDAYQVFSEEDINTSISQLETESKREEFFDYQYHPMEPEKKSKPFYPIWKLVKVTIGYFLLWIILTIVVSVVPVGYTKYKVEKVNEETKAEVAEYFSNNVVIAAESAVPGEESSLKWHRAPAEDLDSVLMYEGLERSWKGLLGGLMMLLPIPLLILRWIMIIAKTAKQRHEISEYNKEQKAIYNICKYIHTTRATKYEYMEFCRHYLSPQSPCLSTSYDPVAKALREYAIDETDMRGKILFLNYFEDEDVYGNYTTSPILTMRYVYYVIAIPQRDKLVLLKNRWDTLSDEVESCDAESVFYRNILSINVSNGEIEIEKTGGTTSGVVLPSAGVSLFEYQDHSPHNPMTYSTTRTSNPHVFVKALETLIARQ